MRSFYQKFLTVILSMVFTMSLTSIFAQTERILPLGDGGFENGATFGANGWTESSGSNNPWSLGTAISTAPFNNRSAYISNDGGATTAYDITTPCGNYFWRDITIPAGETKIVLTFNWQGQGESTWDMWQVFTAPTSITPVGSNVHPGSGATNIPVGITGATYVGNGNLQGTIQTATLFLPPSLAGTTFRLIFFWKSDTSGGTQPPAGIDNISLLSSLPGNYVSVASGDYNAPATWGTIDFPSAADNATVSAGHTVTINALNLGANNLTIDGTCTFNTTATTMIVNGNLTVNAGGLFNVFVSTTGKRLNLFGNLTNNGEINLSVGASSTTTNGILNLTGSTVQTLSGAGVWTGGIIRNVLMTNSNASIPNIIWNINNLTVLHQLNLTGARVNLSGNTLLSGNSTSTSPTLVFPNGTGFMNGVFGRYFTTSQTGSAFTINLDPTTTTSQFPFVNASGQNRSMWVRRTSSSTTGNTAGYVMAQYNDGTGVSTITPVDDAGYMINRQFNGSWTVTTGGGYVYVSGTHQMATLAPSGYFAANGNSRLMYMSSILGTHENGSITPGAKRFNLSTADLTGGNWYMGINDVDIPFVSVASGAWSDPATWSKGLVPTCTDGVNIVSGHTVTLSTPGNQALNLTVASGGTYLMSGNSSLTIGCTNNNNFLVNNGTVTVTRGTLTINGNMLHNAGSTFNQSGGEIIVDGNDNGNIATSVASGVSLVQLNSENINWTSGVLTIVDPHAHTTASNSFAYTNSIAHVNVTTGIHTIKFGNGVSTQPGGNSTNGFRINTFAGSNRLSFNNFEVLGGAGTNRYVTSTYSFGINGNLTIQTDGEFRPGQLTYVTGDIVNNGTMTHTSTLHFATFIDGVGGIGTNPQTISGAGLFRNNATTVTANLVSMTINNIGGVTLGVPLTMSGTLLFTNGIINTTATNTLHLGTITAAGTLSTSSVFSNTTYINGPFLRTFGTTTATNTLTNIHLFPTGKGGNYFPIWVSPTTTAPTVLSSETFNDAMGTAGSGVSNLSNNRWVVSANVPAQMTFAHVQLGDAAITPTNQILQSASAAGVYAGIVTGTLFTGGTPNTIKTNPNGSPIPNASFTGFFKYGDLTPCVAPAMPPTGLVFSQVSSTSLTGMFNASAPPADGYLVVRYPNGGTPTLPVDGTPYAAGAGLGGTIVSYGSATTFNVTGLTISTLYDFYVYGFNSIGCGGGPVYLTSSYIFSTVSTCNTLVNPITTLFTSARTQTTFTINWTASTTPGVDYFVDVATDAGFTNIIQVANPAGPAVTYQITGLTAGTTFHFRVRAFDGGSGCFSTNVASSNGTLCPATGLPYIENLNGALTCLSVLSTGTGNAWGIVAAPVTPSGMTGNTGRIISSTSAATNNYIVGRAVNLTGGVSHDIEFKYGNSSGTPTMSMDIIYSAADLVNGGIVTANNVVIHTLVDINNTVSNTTTLVFTPPTTGEYYLMFRAFGPIAASTSTLYVDDIEVRETPPCSAASGGTMVSSVTGMPCGNTNSTSLSASGFSLGLGMTYQWQQSNDNFNTNIVDIPGQTNPLSGMASLNLGANDFRLRANCVNGPLEGFSNVVSATYSNPQPLTTMGGSRCGTGTVDLTGTVNMGDDLNWYANPTGGAPLGSGTTFTTPSINTTTNFYVAAVSGGTTANVGPLNPTTVGTVSASTIAIGTQRMFFDVTSPVTILSIDIFPTATIGSNGSITIRDNTQQIIADIPYVTTVTAGGLQTIPINVILPVGNGYEIGQGTAISLNRNTTGASYPYTNGGVSIIGNTFDPLYYYFFYNWLVSTGCEGTRTAVTATVSSPPVLTLSSNMEDVCAGSASNLVTITSNIGDFDSYVWSPASGVTGDENNGYMFNPAVTTSYVLTASQTNPPLCSNTANMDINILPLPQGLDITPADPISINCGDVQILTASVSSPATSVSSYSFVASTGAGLDPMTGATTIIASSVDDTPSGLNAIGFDFVYDGVTFTDFSVSPDGFVRLGSPAASSQFTNSITSTTNIPKLYPYWDDMATGTDGSVRYTVTGTAPNRILVVEWFVTIPRNTTGAANSTFQAWLYETSNLVEFRYGSMGPGSMSASVGLSGNTPATNFNCVTVSSNTNSTVTANDSNADQPASGRMYSFSPPVPPPTVYLWSGPVGTLFTDLAATIPYTGQDLATVYAKPLVSGVNTYTVMATGVNTCSDMESRDITVGSCGVALTLTSFIEGFMDGGSMRPVLLNSGVFGATGSQCDTITVSLHNNTFPYAMAYEFEGVMGINGQTVCDFPAGANGGTYYIVVTHRSALETWSASPQLFTVTNTYNFSTAATQAFGSNMKMVGGVWSFYSADIDGSPSDGNVDLIDYPVWETDYNNLEVGYFKSDMNGDGSVDLIDYPIWETNYNNLISVIKP
ncbi:MAG: fibronectin type III domain-containing protein [Saprospiraceae bacterium]